MNSKKFVVIALLCVMFTSQLLSVGAQAFHRIFTSGYIADMSWSADGQLFAFHNGGDPYLLSEGKSVWYQYDPTTETLTQEDMWPFQPDLSAGEIELYQPAKQTLHVEGETNEYDTFLFSSPDDNYMVYPSQAGANDLGIPIMLANRQTQTVAETYLRTFAPVQGLNGLNVIWNHTSTAFVAFVRSYQDLIVVGYGRNFTTNITDLIVNASYMLSISGNSYLIHDIYAISDDGSNVLVNVKDESATSAANQDVFRLALWDAVTNTATLVGDFDGGNIRAAMYDDGDDDEILMVNESGIIRYTVSTEQITILNVQVTSAWAHDAVFANGGRYLAVMANEDGGSVYVFDLDTDFVGLKVQYYPESTTRMEFSEIIEPQFNIVNMSDNDVDMTDLIIRYYFSRDSEQPLEAVCSWTALPNECDDVTATAHTMTPVPGADSYLEVGFTDGTLDANSETQDIIVRVNKQDWSDFDQHGDFSFDVTSTSDTYVDWTRIALYYQGKLVWGTEPW